MMRFYISLESIHYFGPFYNGCSVNGFMIDEAMKRNIKLHHVHIDSLLAHFFLNYVLNGSLKGYGSEFSKKVRKKSVEFLK